LRLVLIELDQSANPNQSQVTLEMGRTTEMSASLIGRHSQAPCFRRLLLTCVGHASLSGRPFRWVQATTSIGWIGLESLALGRVATSAQGLGCVETLGDCRLNRPSRRFYRDLWFLPLLAADLVLLAGYVGLRRHDEAQLGA